MNWIYNFQLFLLDFDGLLVDTEELQFAAYVRMCRNRGYELNWSFEKFCSIAHKSSTGMKEAIYRTFPELEKEEPDWSCLHREKKAAYLQLLSESSPRLMPSVAPFLEALQKAGIKRCVVTNSPYDQVCLIKRSIPLLQTIPLWITRELYDLPKPAPDAYRKAVALLAEDGDQVIGFEDSLRGLQALQDAGVRGVLISPQEEAVPVPQFRSFAEILHLGI